MFNHIAYKHPDYLWFLLILPVLAAWHVWHNRKNDATLNYSETYHFTFTNTTIRLLLFYSLPYLRLLILALLIITIAKPYSTTHFKNTEVEGIDIVIVKDISSSMLAEDLKPNRLKASKRVAETFIQERKNDRIGLVVFSGDGFTQCPITIDHGVLLNLLRDVETGMVDDGTAIGNGLAVGVNRLKESSAKSKVIILLTDGENNAGEIDPITAAELAKKYGIRVYTIGAGTYGKAPYPFKTPAGIIYETIDVKIDEPLLKKIASITNGKYFRATSTKGLQNIYHEINTLEKTIIETTSYSKHKEYYHYLLIPALLLLFIELIIKYLISRRVI